MLLSALLQNWAGGRCIIFLRSLGINLCSAMDALTRALIEGFLRILISISAGPLTSRVGESGALLGISLAIFAATFVVARGKNSGKCRAFPRVSITRDLRCRL
jgi:hypothetical protein